MSNTTVADNEWLEKSISEGHINYYERSDLKVIKNIGSGAFGDVFHVYWKDATSPFALKAFNSKQTLKEFVKEVRYFNSLIKCKTKFYFIHYIYDAVVKIATECWFS